MDNLFIGVRLAIDNRFMLRFFGLRQGDVMFLSRSVVPTAIPSRKQIGVLLPGSGELRASQSLDVKPSISVGIGRQIRLCIRARYKTMPQ